MWKKIRISILSLILAYVSIGAYQDTHHNWDKHTKIVLHPINMDGQEATQKYIDSLTEKHFEPMEIFVKENSIKYRNKEIDFDVVLGDQVYRKPRLPNEETAASMLKVILWSLECRFFGVWNYKADDWGASSVMYLAYYNPKTTDELSRSTALERGRVGVVNLYVGETGTNNHIILHETFHTFGGEDRYDSDTGVPIHPQGYAEPNKVPLFPQKKAEIMGGYILVNDRDILVPTSLDEVMMNEVTAQEIGWIKKK